MPAAAAVDRLEDESEQAAFQSLASRAPTPSKFGSVTVDPTKVPSALPSPLPSAAPSAAPTTLPSETPSESPTIAMTSMPSSITGGDGTAVMARPIGLGTPVPTLDVIATAPTPQPSALGAVINALVELVYDLSIKQDVQAVVVEPARRATFVGRVPFTPVDGARATQFYYSKNSEVSSKARAENNSSSTLPARRRSLLSDSSLAATLAPSMQDTAAAEWYVKLNLQNASYLNTSFDLAEFSATDVPLSNSQVFVLFRKRPGYPDIFCISESDMANASYVRLGAARGNACATFSLGRAGSVSERSSFRSFGISPFAFRNEESTIVGVHQLCQKDRASQMAQVFALGCNVTRKGDVVCDIKSPSRSVLLRISCDGHVEKLRLKNDTVILSPVACVIEGRLEPSDLFCRDPTSAHQLLGPLAFVFLSAPCFPIEVNSALSIAGMMAGTLSRELPNCTAELVSSQVPCANITSDDPRLLLEGTASGAWSNWKCIMDQYGNECMKQMPEDGNVATMYGLTPCNAQDRYICTRGCVYE